MAVDDWYQRQFGDRASFALSFSLGPDGHPVGPPARDATWGGLEIWAKGHCLTRSVADGAVQDAVRWSLLPVLEWLLDVGQRLVNEDPYPRFSRGLVVPDGSAWFDATVSPPVLDEAAEKRWFLRRSEWRHFHALRRSALDVALPNVVFRRLGDSMEVSWDNEAWTSGRRGLSFVERRGRVVVGAAALARVLSEAVSDVTKSLAERAPVTPLIDLASRASASRAQSNDWRWLLHRPTAEIVRDSFPALKLKLESHITANAIGLYVPHIEETHLLRLVRAESETDVKALLAASQLLPPHPAASELQALVRPSTAASERPWEEGNDYADFVREKLGWGTDPLPELGAWLTGRGLLVESGNIGLPSSISVLAERSVDNRAAVHVNPRGASRRKKETGLATALGHVLLDDGPYSVDGDWEHWPTSARARAFGVALTLPEEGVRDALTNKPNIGAAEVLELMAKFRAGPFATTYRLKNLGLISSDDQLDLAQVVYAQLNGA